MDRRLTNGATPASVSNGMPEYVLMMHSGRVKILDCGEIVPSALTVTSGRWMLDAESMPRQSISLDTGQCSENRLRMSLQAYPLIV